NGISKTQITSRKSPTNRRLSRTPSRNSKICRNRAGEPAFPPPCWIRFVGPNSLLLEGEESASGGACHEASEIFSNDRPSKAQGRDGREVECDYRAELRIAR